MSAAAYTHINHAAPRRREQEGEHTMKHRSKRFLSVLLSLALVLGLIPGISFTAQAANVCPYCGSTNFIEQQFSYWCLNCDLTFDTPAQGGGGGGGHTHAWATAWSYDATNHWHACTADGATDACLNETGAAKAAHTYGDTGDARFTCTVCENVDTTKQAEAVLADAKTTATTTVNGVVADDYIAADRQTVTDAKTTALEAINTATTEAEVTTALNNFNNAIATCTTQEAQDLADAKTTATATVNDVDADDYIAADRQTVTDAKTTALGAMNAATTEEDAVSYVYYTLDGNTAIRHTDGSQSTYTTVTSSTTSWSNGWYVVNSDVTVSSRISVTGTVYLMNNLSKAPTSTQPRKSVVS